MTHTDWSPENSLCQEFIYVFVWNPVTGGEDPNCPRLQPSFVNLYLISQGCLRPPMWNPGAHRSQGENYCPKESQKWMVFCWLFDCFNNTYKFFFKAIFHSYKTEFQAKYTSCNPTHLSHHNQETICPVVQGQNLRENLKFLMAEMSRWCSNFPCLWLSTLCSLISLFPRTSWGLIFFLIGAVSLAPLIIQSPLNSVTSLLSLFKSYASFKS